MISSGLHPQESVDVLCVGLTEGNALASGLRTRGVSVWVADSPGDTPTLVEFHQPRVVLLGVESARQISGIATLSERVPLVLAGSHPGEREWCFAEDIAHGYLDTSQDTAMGVSYVISVLRRLPRREQRRHVLGDPP